MMRHDSAAFILKFNVDDTCSLELVVVLAI
jgi:hypothetical protein